MQGYGRLVCQKALERGVAFLLGSCAKVGGRRREMQLTSCWDALEANYQVAVDGDGRWMVARRVAERKCPGFLCVAVCWYQSVGIGAECAVCGCIQ